MTAACTQLQALCSSRSNFQSARQFLIEDEHCAAAVKALLWLGGSFHVDAQPLDIAVAIWNRSEHARVQPQCRNCWGT
eukprot:2766228-Alexandrium_andersonii.AAC.1